MSPKYRASNACLDKSLAAEETARKALSGMGLSTTVTLADVASAAGVSLSTASKALNGRGQLREETRERVRAAAQRLGFEPNAVARSLMQGRTYTVGLLTSDSFGRFSIPLLLGVEDGIGAGQMSVFLCDARDDPVRERHYVQNLLARRVDGLIVTGRRTDVRPPIADGKLPVPVVYAYTQSASEQDVSLLPDDAQGARLAVEHLLAIGRRRLAHVTGPSRFRAVLDRLEGARHVMASAGLELPDELVLTGSWSEAWGYEAAQILLQQGRPVDGVVCGSDQIARGFVDGLRERGVRVPDDVAVVGFDNWEPIAEAARPPLTTVDLGLKRLGEAAAQRLLAMIDGQSLTGVERLPCDLVIRGSTGPPSLREPVGLRGS
jgi:LacI family transcriptional regulator, galactose operon repressor